MGEGVKKRKKPSDDMPSDVSKLEGWKRAGRVADPLTVKVPTRRVTINIDEDIIAIFKAEALQGGPPYQVAINQALRSHLRQTELAGKEQAIEVVLKALDDRAVRRKIRQIRGGSARASSK